MAKTFRIEIGIIIFVALGTTFLIAYGYISPQGLFATGYPVSTTPTLTSLTAIKAGTFASALDKQGTNGTLVQVNGLTVLGVTKEIDGDIHVDVGGATCGCTMVTEITPIAQRFLNDSIPQVNMTITEIGTVYCDAAHASEAWHGGTCYELHPVVAWKQTGIAAPASLAATRFQFIPESGDES